MLKVAVWNKGVTRVELDQRARDTRLQLERMEQLLGSRVAGATPWWTVYSATLALWLGALMIILLPLAGTVRSWLEGIGA